MPPSLLLLFSRPSSMWDHGFPDQGSNGKSLCPFQRSNFPLKCKLGGNPLSRGWGKLFTKLSLSKVENCLSMGILGEASVHRSLPKPGSGKATLTPYRSWGQQKPIEKAQRNRDKDESAFYDVPSATSRQRPLLIKFNSDNIINEWRYFSLNF